mmetsp:Transcript_1782/g.4546  ORF Transcript_1782/g.4546 Transcript_1782/m.4546 type:complete len:203 (-) Transcript_1782:3-611(-)
MSSACFEASTAELTSSTRTLSNGVDAAFAVCDSARMHSVSACKILSDTSLKRPLASLAAFSAAIGASGSAARMRCDLVAVSRAKIRPLALPISLKIPAASFASQVISRNLPFTNSSLSLVISIKSWRTFIAACRASDAEPWLIIFSASLFLALNSSYLSSKFSSSSNSPANSTALSANLEASPSSSILPRAELPALPEAEMA